MNAAFTILAEEISLDNLDAILGEDLGGCTEGEELVEGVEFNDNLREAMTELYPGCNDFSIFRFVVKLLNLKITNGLSDKAFTNLLQLLRMAMPSGRKSATVAREEMAMAKGFPESSIGRVESYKFIHKRKSGEPQDLELVASILENTAILKAFMSQGRTSMPDVTSPCSSHARYTPCMPVVNEFIGKECDLRGGWPLRVVARGIMQDVDPTIEFGDKRLEEGNFKVYVNVVYGVTVALPLSHDV
ncbi:hypothetical protein IFM89_035550 [Coptis chinensis]|uniref:Uncharacterized protein n=1 Tax=Coptis chinensis TaxID=261450 RepID=A0A835HZR8_9MAGN|nr:hypothetical protein IFM89_035550 [Coptis chinensis]